MDVMKLMVVALGGLGTPANAGGMTEELPPVAWWIASLLLPGCVNP
jgi:hypothetical protein